MLVSDPEFPSVEKAVFSLLGLALEQGTVVEGWRAMRTPTVLRNQYTGSDSEKIVIYITDRDEEAGIRSAGTSHARPYGKGLWTRHWSYVTYTYDREERSRTYHGLPEPEVLVRTDPILTEDRSSYMHRWELSYYRLRTQQTEPYKDAMAVILWGAGVRRLHSFPECLVAPTIRSFGPEDALFSIGSIRATLDGNVGYFRGRRPGEQTSNWDLPDTHWLNAQKVAAAFDAGDEWWEALEITDPYNTYEDVFHRAYADKPEEVKPWAVLGLVGIRGEERMFKETFDTEDNSLSWLVRPDKEVNIFYGQAVLGSKGPMLEGLLMHDHDSCKDLRLDSWSLERLLSRACFEDLLSPFYDALVRFRHNRDDARIRSVIKLFFMGLPECGSWWSAGGGPVPNIERAARFFGHLSGRSIPGREPSPFRLYDFEFVGVRIAVLLFSAEHITVTLHNSRFQELLESPACHLGLQEAISHGMGLKEALRILVSWRAPGPVGPGLLAAAKYFDAKFHVPGTGILTRL